jgi:hypothetical protein
MIRRIQTIEVFQKKRIQDSGNHHCVLKPNSSLSTFLIEINEYHSLRTELELILLFLLFKYSLEISFEISDAKL